jgi:hypothetical protein
MKKTLSRQKLDFPDVKEQVTFVASEDKTNRLNTDSYQPPNKLGRIEVVERTPPRFGAPEHYILVGNAVPKPIKDALLKHFSEYRIAKQGEDMRMYALVPEPESHSKLSNTVHNVLTNALSANKKLLKPAKISLTGGDTALGSTLTPEQQHLLNGLKTAAQTGGELKTEEVAAISGWLHTLQQSDAVKKAGLNVSFTLGK